ncbi:outer membrane cobalamin receptor protein [Thioflavicoccus mobilis 8321]|uniref:Outer membrane cobalamin receptor protein n=1 Tax=Thioflavicoccus mobilis 8321 TaxID=765912 RepID=L0GZH6_9GAMM|nr:TonB-dependent receptor [Thioflavicoccus mobilis]AGA91227.1 outer membrane cobalamin receptor protein [Thioflavicoccus mobilis 8321]
MLVRRILPASLYGLLVGGLVTAAVAEPVTDEQPIAVELDAIEVTAGVPVPGDPMLQAADVDVLTGEELRRRARLTLGETLESLPGVSSITAGNTVGKPVIRGLSGNQIQVLSNGVGVDYQQYGERHPPNIDPFLAERIEVVRGASSLLYGSGALGGAIDVQAPAFVFSPEGESAASGDTLFTYHSNNGQWDTGAKARASSDWLSIDAGLIRRSAGNLNTPNAKTAAESGDSSDPKFTGELPFTDFDQLNGQFGVGVQTDIGEFGVRYTQWNNENNYLLPNGKGIGLWLRNDQLQFTGAMPLASGWELKPTLSWQNNLRRANSAGTPLSAGYDGTVHLEFDRYVARFEAVHDALGPFDGGTLGVEYSNKIQYSRGTTVLASGGEVGNLALFAFESKDIGALTLQAGLRHDWHSVTGDAGKTSATVNFTGRDNHDYAEFTGSLGAVYRLTDQLAIASNLGRGFRAPSLFELYADGVHGGVSAIQEGNPDLDPETSLNIDLGLRWRSPSVQGSATLYRNAISDYIYLEDTGESRDDLPVFAYKQDDALLTGLELEARWQVTDRIELGATLDVVRGTNDRTDEDLPLLPADTLKVEATYRFPERGMVREPYFTLGVRHAAAKDAAPGEPFAQFDDMPFGTASTDAYTLVDLDLGFAFRAFGSRLARVDLAVRNLFDIEYRDFLDTYKGYALSPGRDISLSVSVPFGG